MIERTACFTGHRIIQNEDLPRLKERLGETISELVGQGVTRFLNGGATGFDTMAAYAVLTARNQNQDIKLCMALPCSNQDERWKPADKQTYKHLLETADEVIYVSEQPYFQGCMEQRNIYLVENSGVCVAYMKHGRSGTSQTVRLARERGLKVINLADK